MFCLIFLLFVNLLIAQTEETAPNGETVTTKVEELESETISDDGTEALLEGSGRYKKIIDDPLISIDFQRESQKLLSQNLSNIRFLRTTLINHNMKESLNSLVENYIKAKELYVQDNYQRSSFILAGNEDSLKKNIQEILSKYKKEISKQYRKIASLTIDFDLKKKLTKELNISIKKYESLYVEINKQAQELEKSQSYYESLKFYKKALEQLYIIRTLIETSDSKNEVNTKNLQLKMNEVLVSDEKLFLKDIRNELYQEEVVDSNLTTETVKEEESISNELQPSLNSKESVSTDYQESLDIENLQEQNETLEE